MAFDSNQQQYLDNLKRDILTAVAANDPRARGSLQALATAFNPTNPSAFLSSWEKEGTLATNAILSRFFGGSSVDITRGAIAGLGGIGNIRTNEENGTSGYITGNGFQGLGLASQIGQAITNAVTNSRGGLNRGFAYGSNFSDIGELTALLTRGNQIGAQQINFGPGLAGLRQGLTAYRSITGVSEDQNTRSLERLTQVLEGRVEGTSYEQRMAAVVNAQGGSVTALSGATRDNLVNGLRAGLSAVQELRDVFGKELPIDQLETITRELGESTLATEKGANRIRNRIRNIRVQALASGRTTQEIATEQANLVAIFEYGFGYDRTTAGITANAITRGVNLETGSAFSRNERYGELTNAARTIHGENRLSYARIQYLLNSSDPATRALGRSLANSYSSVLDYNEQVSLENRIMTAANQRGFAGLDEDGIEALSRDFTTGEFGESAIQNSLQQAMARHAQSAANRLSPGSRAGFMDVVLTTGVRGGEFKQLRESLLGATSVDERRQAIEAYANAAGLTGGDKTRLLNNLKSLTGMDARSLDQTLNQWYAFGSGITGITTSAMNREILAEESQRIQAELDSSVGVANRFTSGGLFTGTLGNILSGILGENGISDAAALGALAVSGGALQVATYDEQSGVFSSTEQTKELARLLNMTPAEFQERWNDPKQRGKLRASLTAKGYELGVKRNIDGSTGLYAAERKTIDALKEDYGNAGSPDRYLSILGSDYDFDVTRNADGRAAGWMARAQGGEWMSADQALSEYVREALLGDSPDAVNRLAALSKKDSSLKELIGTEGGRILNSIVTQAGGDPFSSDYNTPGKLAEAVRNIFGVTTLEGVNIDSIIGPGGASVKSVGQGMGFSREQIEQLLRIGKIADQDGESGPQGTMIGLLQRIAIAAEELSNQTYRN